MKKLLSTVMILALMFTFVACNNSTSSNNETPSKTSSTASSDKSSDTTSENNSDKTSNGKILVVYYSATGSTKAVAQTIADTANADLFEITPVDPYTSDDLNWTDNSRVSVEHNDESKRDVKLTKTTPDNWEQYDTVFVGYPIWWGIAAWPVNNFINGNDFSGKTVIPFCTSASSGLGESGSLLAEMSGTGNWQDGERFSSGASSDDVANWVNGLELK